MDNTDVREGRVVGRVPADTFAHRLLLARADAGLTIEQAAAKCGLLSQSWGNWEKGRIPRDILDVAASVAAALGVDRDWLLHGGPLSQPIRANRTTKAVSPPYSHRRRRVARRTAEIPDHPMSTVRRPKRLDRRVAA